MSEANSIAVFAAEALDSIRMVGDDQAMPTASLPPHPPPLRVPPMMKMRTTAVLAMAISFASPAIAGNCFQKVTCCPSSPSQPTCASAPVESCMPMGGMSAHDMGSVDNPSELNVALTTELVALREQVAIANESLAENESKIDEANQTIASMQEEMASVKAKLAAQTQRADTAVASLAAAEKASQETQDAAQEQQKNLQQQLANVRKNMQAKNAELRKQLKASKDDLAKANSELANERKEREEERRQQQVAAETPLVTPKEDEAIEGEAPADDRG